jgi:hypothetical protein
MIVIIVEGVLFIAGIAIMGALLFYAVLEFTPIGVRIRQTQNRNRLERAAELNCAIHGRRAEVELVRLPSGERVCPDCYKETFHGNLD